MDRGCGNLASVLREATPTKAVTEEEKEEEEKDCGDQEETSFIQVSKERLLIIFISNIDCQHCSGCRSSELA